MAVALWVADAIVQGETELRRIRVVPMCEEHLSHHRTWNRSKWAGEMSLDSHPGQQDLAGLCYWCVSPMAWPNDTDDYREAVDRPVRTAVVSAWYKGGGGIGQGGPDPLCAAHLAELLQSDRIHSLGLAPYDPDDPWLPEATTYDDLYTGQPSRSTCAAILEAAATPRN